MATVFLDGRFVSADEARVSAFDAGFQHGVGVFETMLGGVTRGDGAPDTPDDDAPELGDGEAWIHRLDDHLDRLIDSAAALGLTDALRKPALAETVRRTVARSGLARARVRLTVTGGDMSLLGGRDGGTEGRRDGNGGVETGRPAARRPHDPTILIVAQPATEYPESMFDEGVTAVIGDTRANPLDPLAGHKTLSYWGRLRELSVAARKRAGEAIVLQVTNHLAGGCVSNIFLAKDGLLLTPIARGEEAEGGAKGPSLPSPVLPGVTRRAVIALAGERGVECLRRMLSIEDLLGADEVFLTNSSWGVMPVVGVERSVIGAGAVGELSRELLAAWRGEVEGMT
ncbi:MAG: aminotransferase class IV [Phycisphaerales bacterium]